MEFRILGPLQIVAAGREWDVGPARLRTVLAVLLLERNRVVPLSRLVDAVWADEPPHTARAQIHICVSALRRTLAAAGEGELIHTVSPGYLLRVADGAVDLDVFQQLVAAARADTAAGRLAGAADKLRTGLGLWRGAPLAGVDSAPVRSRATGLADTRLSVLEEYLDLELALGHHEEAGHRLAVLVEEHPLRERLRYQLMLALYRSGRTADALAAYRLARRVLVEELGIEPGAELRKLERGILAADPALAPPVEPGTQAVSASPVTPRELPTAIADFTGRADLVATMRHLLDPGPAPDDTAVKIIVVTGPAGVGKTTLAVRLTQEVSDGYAGGQLFAQLHGAEPRPTRPAKVLERFLRALGAAGGAIPAALEERVYAYRSMVAGRRLLVLLDDAASEEQVRPLLPGTAGSVVVITSRRRLTGLAGARHIEVDVLDEAASVELLSAILSPGAAADNASTRALVERCGGLPLAIRIAAARLAARPHWSISDLVGRLDDEQRRLDEFVHGGLCVRSSVSLTYDGLPPAARRLFRLLGILSWSNFPAWVAAPLLDLDPGVAADLLEVLVEARAVEVVRGTDGPRPRYRLHDLLGVFARERLAAEEPAEERVAALRRLLGCLLQLMEQAHRLEYGGDYTLLHSAAPRWILDTSTVADLLIQPLRSMERERSNLVEAIGQAARAGLQDFAWDLAMSSVFLFEHGMHFDDWRETHELALMSARRQGDRRGEAAMLYSLGALAVAEVQPQRAVTHLEAAHRLFVDLGFPHGCGLALRNLAFVDRIQGRLDDATEKYEESLRLLRSVGDRVGEAHALNGLARIHLERHRPEAARTLLHEALIICRGAGSRRVAAQALHCLGELHVSVAEYEEAQRQFEAVLAIVRQTGDSAGEAFARHGLAVAALRQGRHTDAEAHLAAGVEQARRSGARLVEAHMLLARAEVHSAGGRPAAAAAELIAASRIYRELGATSWQAVAQRLVGDLYLADDGAVAGAVGGAAPSPGGGGAQGSLLAGD